MSTFVESLKRLYNKGLVSVGKLDELLAKSKISQEEYNYIVA